jgi:hypothetical protein
MLRRMGLAVASTRPRFEIERALGAGGMGVVHLVWDHERRMRVARKALAGTDPALLQRLKNEFRALADLAHPNLVALYELFAEDDQWFFTMEAVDGVRFDAWCAAVPMLGEEDLYVTTRVQARRRDAEPTASASEDRGKLERPVADLDRLRRALTGLVDGVEALHAAGKVHCDLKPSNVLVTDEGRVVVLDFGLVRERGQLGEISTGSLEGTPAFIAPELVRDQAPSFASDWYAVGVMAFQALTGELPVRAGHVAAMLYQKMEKDAPRVSSRVKGVPPELDALVAALLERDPARRAGGSAIRAWLAGSSEAPSIEVPIAEPPFVGREAELAALEEGFASTEAGRPRFVFVRGPSGMGKSALVRTFGDRLSREGRALVLASRCYEREQVPFKALDGIVDALTSHLARMPRAELFALLPEGIEALAVLFPVLRAIDAVAELPLPDTRDPTAVRAAAANAARILVRRLGERRPLVIAIDDLQWGDVDSAALMAQIVDPRSETRALLVASARDGASEPDFLRALRQAAPSRVVDIALGPLSSEASIALAQSLLSEPDRAQALVSDAGGHPFFLTELARHRGSPGVDSVDAVVAARVRELGDEPRTLLETACVAGVPIAPDRLAHAVGLDSDPLPALRLLNARMLLRSGSRGRAEIEPYHDRIREVVVSGLEAEHRRRIHASLGAVLADDVESEPETVAAHLAAGGDPARALPFQIRAAERASRALAFDRAVLLYERAVELASDADAREPLRVALADALVLAGRSREAAPLYLACAEGASGAERARLERRAAEEWLKCGRIDDGIAVLRRVLGEVDLRYPDSQLEALGRALFRIVRIRRMDGRFEERSESSIAPATLARVDAARAAGTGLMLVDPLRGYGFLARFLLDAVDAGEPRRVSAGLSLNAVTLCRGGEAGYPKASAWLAQARHIAERLDDDYLRGLADACEAGASVCTGRWSAGARLGLTAPTLLRSSGTPATWESTAAVSLARTSLLFLGELAKLREHTARHERAAEDVGDLFAATYARVHGWFAAAMDDDVAAGRAKLEEALSKWSRLGFHAMHLWRLYGELQYDLYEGAPSRGIARLHAQRPALKRSRILAMQFYRAFLTATEAELELACAEEAPSERLERWRAAERCIAALRREGRPYTDGLAALAAARLALGRGRHGEALRELAAAKVGFDASAMALHGAAVSALRGRVIGGDEGRAAVADARATVAAQGVAMPDRWLTMLGAPIEG